MKRLQNFRLRLRVCLKVLFDKHWLMISLTEEHLDNILEDKAFEVSAEQLGLHKYLINKMIDGIAENIDEHSLLLNRMEFEAEAEEWGKNR